MNVVFTKGEHLWNFPFISSILDSHSYSILYILYIICCAHTFASMLLASCYNRFLVVKTCWQFLQVSGVKKFICPVCNASIIHTTQNIKRHMRELHSDGQPHTCSTCNRTYDSYHKLQRHLKSHGDTGGICHVCGKVRPKTLQWSKVGKSTQPPLHPHPFSSFSRKRKFSLASVSYIHVYLIISNCES